MIMAQVAERTYPARKTDMLRKIEQYANENSVIALSKIRKVRAGQMMLLRKNFRKDLKVIVVKNKIAAKALGNSEKKNLAKFMGNLTDQNALIFTDMNPFKLQLMFDKNKIELPARSGDIATGDIVILAGNTGIPPGPVLSEFKELKVPTKIDAGNIVLTEDTVVLKTGEQVSPKLAGMLARLGLKPIKAGLSIASAYMDNVIFTGENLRINLEEYRQRIQEACGSALAVSVNAAYLTKETTPLIIGRAHIDAKALALAAAYVTDETAGNVLSSGQQKALTLLNLAKQKGYS